MQLRGIRRVLDTIRHRQTGEIGDRVPRGAPRAELPFRHQGNPRPRIERLDGGASGRPAAADDQDIGLEMIHCTPPTGTGLSS